MAYHILLVEDDPDNRLKVKHSLQNSGFVVTDAAGEQQAYEAARNKSFDIAIIDLMLENADSGFSLCYHLKQNHPKLPIILLSSSTSEMDIEFSMESAWERNWIKADMLLNKPIRFEQLLYATQRLLGCLVQAH